MERLTQGALKGESHLFEDEKATSGTTGVDPGWIVTVFDNDHNTVEEVVTVLIRATGCSFQEAEIETWEIDRLGKSVVHFGDELECRSSAAVIAEIGIRVEVSQE